MGIFYRTTLTYRYISTMMQNVLHFDSIENSQTAELINSHYRARLLPVMLPLWQQGVTAISLETHSVQSVPVQPAHVLPLNEVGTGGPSQSPPTYAWKIFLRTALPGKQHRGRIYIGGIPMNLFGSNMIISQLGFDRLNLYCQTLRENFTDGGGNQVPGLHLVILHKNPAVEPTRVTVITPSAICGNQRRRNFGVGI